MLLGCLLQDSQSNHLQLLSFHRKVAGESLHDVNAINAIKIAGSDSAASVRFDSEDALMYIIMEQRFTFMFQSSNHSIVLLG